MCYSLCRRDALECGGQTWTQREELTIEAGCLLLGDRAINPRKLRSKLLAQLCAHHPGMLKMKAVARGYFWCPGLDREIEQIAKKFLAYQSVKRAPPVSTLHPWVWPKRLWQRIYLNFVGPFQGFMFFVIVDAHLKWPEVCILQYTLQASNSGYSPNVEAKI